MDLFNVLTILFVGLIAGFVNVVAGGGSLLSLPILIFLGLPPVVANATNRIAIFSQNIFAVAGFKSKGVTDFKLSFLLGVYALVGALIGAKLAIDIQGALFNKILAVVMVFVVLITISGIAKPKTVKPKTTNLATKIVEGFAFFFIGIYGGFIQAGVGFLIIGALTALHGFSLVKTNSIKVFVILIYTIAALAMFIYEGKINWLYGGVLAIGNSTGAWFASRWSVNMGDKTIKIFLTITVIALAIKLWLY